MKSTGEVDGHRQMPRGGAAQGGAIARDGPDRAGAGEMVPTERSPSCGAIRQQALRDCRVAAPWMFSQRRSRKLTEWDVLRLHKLQNIRRWKRNACRRRRRPRTISGRRQENRILRRVHRRPSGKGAGVTARRSQPALDRPSRWSTPAPPSSRPRRRTSTRHTRERGQTIPEEEGRDSVGSGPIRIAAKGSSSTTAASTDSPLKGEGVDAAVIISRPGDGLDRLRHLRQVVFRAHHRGGCPETVWKSYTADGIILQFGGETVHHLASRQEGAGRR